MSSTNTSSAGIRRLSSLPPGILEHIASYLAAPSRLIFAIVAESKKTPYQKIMSRTPKHNDESHSLIVGQNWSTLDFGDIEKELAEKLSDDDIKKMLLSINAADRLLRLNLANCTNITGAGLDPLHGSQNLQHFDLSLVAKHQSPILDETPALSMTHVVPILDSMIGHGWNNLSLRYLQLPNDWRYGDNFNETDFSNFDAFIMRYKEMAYGRHLRCGKCSTNITYGDYDGFGSDEYATEVTTCYDCMSSYCPDCRSDEDDSPMIFNCNSCQKCFCSKCSTMNVCAFCEGSCCGACTHHCEDCGSFCDYCKVECKKCNRTSCQGCFEFGEEAISGYRCNICRRTLCEDCVPVRECAYLECSKKMCAECADKGGEEVVHRCIGVLCNQHRLYELQQGVSECEECIRFLSESFKGNDILLEQVKYHKRHAGLEVDEGYCPCKWCSSRPQLRFKVGQLVSCRILPRGDWVRGKIIRLWYQEPIWVENGEWVPYQVQLDGGELIYAPQDTDEVIKALTKKRGRMDT